MQSSQAEKIKETARLLGFELVGVAPAKPVPDYNLFLSWLNKGYAGTMSYLHRGAERRGDPEKILPGVKSIICCGLNYFTDQKKSTDRKEDEAWISAYAWGEDYHKILEGKLKRLEEFIQSLSGRARTKTYVDTGAILERSYAAQAGLGWIGKNSCLINNGIGSFFFLGEILTTLELDYDKPTFDQCGTCTKCLDACPTQAFVEPGVLDARRCLSYLTLEYRGTLTQDLKGHVAGCDICQEVCPYNQAIPLSQEKGFYPREGLVAPKIEQLIGTKSPVPRIKQSQWERNISNIRSSKTIDTTSESSPETE
ncbi:MAG: tRNA epoxyqueuosine(34) reductase QueG [bacterium]|nr:tRNA epoxyqueuosine(34) reductase QueG [bacterium]